MKILKQIKELSEIGFAEAVHSGDIESKNFFFKIMQVVDTYAVSLGSENSTCGECVEENYSPPEAGGSKKKRQHNRIQNPKEVNKVAYYLSKYEHHGLFEGCNYNQSETIARAAGLLGVPPATLRNMRDTFDRYTGSHRAGWDASLNDIQRGVFDSMESKTKDQVIRIVQNILVQRSIN